MTRAPSSRADGPPIPVPLQLPGRFNLGNAALALAAAAALGIDAAAAAAVVAGLDSVGGRYGTVHHRGHELRLLLAKNPAGWTETLSLLEPAAALLLVVNAREADGRDTSWLWDVPFEQLAPVGNRGGGRRGEGRGPGAAAQLRRHRPCDGHQPAATRSRTCPPGKVDVVANYTAFRQLSRQIGGERDMSGAGRTALAIVVLLPDVLGTYSDAGNAVVLAERARSRNVAAQVHAVGITDPPPRTADIYLLGGGEDTAQLTAAGWLVRHRMRDALAERPVVLAVCAGLQLLGTTMTDRSGHTYDGAGVLDLTTAPGPRRAVGEVIATATDPTIGTPHRLREPPGTHNPGPRRAAARPRGAGCGQRGATRRTAGRRRSGRDLSSAPTSTARFWPATPPSPITCSPSRRASSCPRSS